MRRVWFWCVVLLIVLLAVTPAHATLKLPHWKLYAEADGTSTVVLEAVVTGENGSPLEGVTVHFQTSAGSITPSEAVTPWYGVVEATLTAPTTPQTVTVTASCSAGSDTCTVEFVEAGSLEEWDAPCGPSVSVYANPDLIPADGASSTELVALVLDANENPVPNVPVIFRTSGGTLVADQAITDANGEARTMLIAPTTAGEVEIYAYAMGECGGSVVVFTELEISVFTYWLSLPANGSSTSTITACITGGHQDPVSDGLTVTFTTDWGKFQESGTNVAAAQTSGGKAMVTLIADNYLPTNNTCIVTATALNYSGSTTINVTQSTPMYPYPPQYPPGYLYSLVIDDGSTPPLEGHREGTWEKPKFFASCMAQTNPPYPVPGGVTLKLTNTDRNVSKNIGMAWNKNSNVYSCTWVVTTERGSFDAQAYGSNSATPVLHIVIGKGLQICLVSVLGEQKGLRYRLPPRTPNECDCSSFVQACHSKVGIKIPRTASAQQSAGTPVTDPVPGDLVFFKGTYGPDPDKVTHVAIFLGIETAYVVNGTPFYKIYMRHASSKAGRVITTSFILNPIKPSESPSYHGQHFHSYGIFLWQDERQAERQWGWNKFTVPLDV